MRAGEKVTETAAAISLASAFDVPRSDSVKAVLHAASWKIGGVPADCRVVLDKAPIIPAFALGVKAAQRAVRFFADEIEAGTPMLFFDSGLRGSDAVFVVREFPDYVSAGSFVRTTCEAQRNPCILIASFEARCFAAVKLTSIVA